MPHAIEMKDGKLLTPFGIRDLLEAVSDYAGEELARYRSKHARYRHAGTHRQWQRAR